MGSLEKRIFLQGGQDVVCFRSFKWLERTVSIAKKTFSSTTNSVRCPKKEQFIKVIKRMKLSISSR